MFPIKDHNPSSKVPYVTYAFIAANVLIFAYTLFVIGNTDSSLAAFYEDFALKPSEITAGQELHTLITAMFLHGGIMHLLGNMLFLYIFGDNLESRLGHLGFIAFYLIAGLGASATQILTNTDSQIFNLGASGAIAGVMGGYLVLYPKARIDAMIVMIYIFRRVTVPAWIMLGYWFAVQAFFSFSTLNATTDEGGVAYWAHAGGFVAGVLLILPVWLLGRNNGIQGQVESKSEMTHVRSHWRKVNK